MSLLIEVFLAATKIMTLVFGLAGLGLSVLLLFCPESVRWLGERVNKSFTLIRLSPLLDRKIETNRLAYRHPFLVGAFFIIGSLFILYFFFFALMPVSSNTLWVEILLDCMVLIGKLAAFVGILLGVTLLVAPEKVRAIEDRLGAWVDTQELFYGLDRPRPLLDHIFLRYPRVSGAAGLLASFVLTILSAYNLAR